MLDDWTQLTLNRQLAFLILCLLSTLDLVIVWPLFMPSPCLWCIGPSMRKPRCLSLGRYFVSRNFAKLGNKSSNIELNAFYVTYLLLWVCQLRSWNYVGFTFNIRSQSLVKSKCQRVKQVRKICFIQLREWTIIESKQSSPCYYMGLYSFFLPLLALWV